MIVQENPRTRNGAAAHNKSIFPESIHKQNSALVAHVQKILSREDPFGTYRMVPINELHTETMYQRAVSKERVLEMCRTFDAALFQPLTIAERSRVLYVVDGQHRVEVARELEIAEVPCVIYVSKDAAQEARRFVELQEKRRTLLAVHKFTAQLAYHDVTATELQKLFRKYRFTIGNAGGMDTTRKKDVVRCISMFQRCYKSGGVKRCDFILNIMRNAWDGSSDSQRREVVQGLNRLGEMSTVTASQAVAALKGSDAFALVQRAKRVAHNNKGNEVQAFAEIVAAMVEKGK